MVKLHELHTTDVVVNSGACVHVKHNVGTLPNADFILVLVHGYPQHLVMWRHLIEHIQRPIVLLDLPGYGKSHKPRGDIKAYSKREIGLDVLNAVEKVVPPNSKVVFAGHDRGARVVHHLVIHQPPSSIVQIAGAVFMDIVPTTVQFENLGKSVAGATSGFHWYFLAQPYPLPDQLIKASSDIWIETMLNRWAGAGKDKVLDALNEYQNAFRDAHVVEGSCEDYRAGATIDIENENEDQAQNKKIRVPVLLVYSQASVGARYNVPSEWTRFVDAQITDAPIGNGIGHFLPEEASAETSSALTSWLDKLS